MDEGFLPLSPFRCATGQIWASGAMLEAYLDLQTMPTVHDQAIVTRYHRDTLKTVQRFEFGNARSH